jgi:hypothetical protein
MLARKFKDGALLDLFDRIIASYRTESNRGIPIGNLTSQFFANAYLGLVDHYVKESLHIPGYVRYMDDMALWSNDRTELKDALKKLGEFLDAVLHLQIKEHSYLYRTCHGMEFLGFRVLPERLLVGRRAGRRFVRRVRGIERDAVVGGLSEAEAQGRLTSMLAFVANADSLVWRRRHLNFGERPMGPRTASIAAAVGTTTPRTVVRRTGTTTTRATATTIWGSASPSAPFIRWNRN